MKTAHKEIEEVEVEVIDDVTCNKCEGSCREVGMEDYGFNCLIEHKITGGYGSAHLGDMTSYTFSLCEKCLVEMFDTFKIPVEVIQY